MDSGRPTAALICLSDACRASISFRRSSGDLEAHKCGGEQIHLAAESARFHHYERVLHGGEGFQLLLAPNLLLAHTELATATAAGGKDNTPEQKVGSGEL